MVSTCKKFNLQKFGLRTIKNLALAQEIFFVRIAAEILSGFNYLPTTAGIITCSVTLQFRSV
jgi:hypothetical protein